MSAAEKLQNPLLDKRLINSFVDGVASTLQTMANTPVTFGKPFVEPKFAARGEIAGVVGMVSHDWKATLTLSFPKPAILSILENMLGEKFTDITDEVHDAVGELTNMIYGSAKGSLNDMGYNFEMAIPTVIKGQFIMLQHTKSATLVIPFKLTQQNAEFFIEISVS
ncbi:MAG: chemotaxis protein CheX [Bdellovibrionaceae bacterium]|nr:chemotaxis protein CheX [Pseudobdellovibrionaceae bacterium]NUM59656.1 chemotaxis protein CheX [Pseudobdellovibrionaceae bacterium]